MSQIVYEDPYCTIICGDALGVIRSLPKGSVQMCMTSPPYHQQRDNRTEGQIGLEADVKNYVDRLAAVFTGVQRVLGKDGSLFLNVDDVYGNRARGGRRKSLMLAPEQLAAALSENNWWLRNKIVWAPDDAEPESVKDRFSHRWEMIYWFTKRVKGYKFYLDRVRIASRILRETQLMMDLDLPDSLSPARERQNLPDWMPAMKTGSRGYHPNGKNPGDVWRIKQTGSRAKHHSAFPEALCIMPILATTDPGDTVLDPFAGTGTTGVAARRLGRKTILVDISLSYCQAMAKRLRGIPVPFSKGLPQ